MHWPVPARVLRPLVPAALPLDTWKGQAYVGLVAFSVQGNRVTLLPPFPLLSRFLEINLRTYVRPPGQDAGVYFFSLDASNAVIAAAARASYGLPYHGARGASRRIRVPGRPARCELHLTRLALGGEEFGCDIAYTPTGAPAAAAEGTLSHFLIERYSLYTADGDAVRSARVVHEPYPVQGARVHRLRQSLDVAAGLPPLGRPALAHYARGVDVTIFAKRSRLVESRV